MASVTQEEDLRGKLGRFVKFLTPLVPSAATKLSILPTTDLKTFYAWVVTFLVPHKAGIQAESEKVLLDLCDQSGTEEDVSSWSTEDKQKAFLYLSFFLDITGHLD